MERGSTDISWRVQFIGLILVSLVGGGGRDLMSIVIGRGGLEQIQSLSDGIKCGDLGF